MYSLYIVIAIVLILGGFLMMAAERWGKRTRDVEKMTWLDSIIIGLWQVLAMIPGVSRSSATISGAMLRDFKREDAARFSFLMSIPALLGAGVVALKDLFEVRACWPRWPRRWPWDFLAAAISGYFSIRWLLGYFKTRSLNDFVIYRFVFGALCLIVILLGLRPAVGISDERSAMLARLRTRVGTICLMLAVLAACAETPQATRTPVTLRLAEAADQAAVLDRVVADYTADHDWVSASAASIARSRMPIARVRSGQFDAAIVHSEPEQKAGVWISGLAHDPIAIIVHPANPIGDVTLAQLSDLFQGRTFDWTPFGGTGEVIPVSREAEAYSRQMFEERVMQTRAVTRNAVLKVLGERRD